MHELNCMEDSMFVHVKKYTIFKIMRQDKMQFPCCSCCYRMVAEQITYFAGYSDKVFDCNAHFLG